MSLQVSRCNHNVCLCACCLRRGIVCLFHRLASWHRKLEWISDGNGDMIENYRHPQANGVLFSVHSDAFQMDRTFFHATRSRSPLRAVLRRWNFVLFLVDLFDGFFPYGSRTKRSPFPLGFDRTPPGFSVLTRVWFLSTDRFVGILAGLSPS